MRLAHVRVKGSGNQNHAWQHPANATIVTEFFAAPNYVNSFHVWQQVTGERGSCIQCGAGGRCTNIGKAPVSEE